jgi:hypothetical protein
MLKRIAAGAVFLSLILTTSQAFAVAEAAVPSLIIPPGARANGMGETYVALAEDATAAWWNPGGLAFLKKRNLALMHSQLVPDLASDVYYEFFGYTNEIGNVGTLAFSLIYLTYGTSVATNVSGEELGTFKSWEASGYASFAMELRKNLGVGLSMKFIHACRSVSPSPTSARTSRSSIGSRATRCPSRRGRVSRSYRSPTRSAISRLRSTWNRAWCGLPAIRSRSAGVRSIMQVWSIATSISSPGASGTYTMRTEISTIRRTG